MRRDTMEKKECDEFLFVCRSCGCKFFTEGEKRFYDMKNLQIPTCCKDCRTANKLNRINVKAVYREILDNWSVEAKKERKEYFYNVDDVNLILQGKRNLVIGRKGSGKTAIAQHLCEIRAADVFSEKLSFKNFPFNILYSLENHREYTVPNQYISIWKYMIYSYICKKMILNQNIDDEARSKLVKLYGNPEKDSLNELLQKWTSRSFSFELLGAGFAHEREQEDSKVTWIDAVGILEDVIIRYCDSAKYFIVFDELDEDYRDFATEIEENNYKCMLTSLMKAVQDIRTIFDDNGKHIYPVVFLRTDIYERIKDSDKTKWKEASINLEWNTNQIKGMLAHRLCVAAGITDMKFDTIWHKFFSKEKVKMGNNQTREMDIYPYIERSTEMRPRDFIQYVKECVKIASDCSEELISPKMVKDADDCFSEYLKSETCDEIYPVLPEVDDILGLLSTIRKQSFKIKTFEEEYNRLVEREGLPKRDVKKILLVLFNAGVIGNSPSMKGQAIFKFSKESPRFNYNETLLVHRGLYKALQIF